MGDEIVNRIANSGLIQLDLEGLIPDAVVGLDIAPWLFQGIALRETEFKQHLADHDWEQYQDQYLHVYCSEDAIIPSWAWMMITREAFPFARKVVQGDAAFLNGILLKEALDQIDPEEYRDAKLVIKGCGDGKLNEFAYTEAMMKLMPVAKSIMFGEPCSTVPIYKKKK